MDFKSVIPHSDIKDLVRAHVDLQIGCYFNDKETCLSGLLCTSKWIDDFFWNTYCSFNETDGDTILNEVTPKFISKKRNPAFYLDPTCEPVSMADYLEKNGYTIEKEIWMSVDKTFNVNEPERIKVSKVTKDDHESFLKVFSVAFGGEATQADGYGDIPDTYLSALRDSLEGKSLPEVKHIHFIAKFENEPVGCGSIHIGPEFAGLYNVGTLPTYRNKGIGSFVSQKAIATAKEAGVKTIFFQTQPGGSVQRFYEGLGCKVIFETALCFKE